MNYPKLLKTKPVLFPIVPLTQLVIDYLFEGGYKGYIVPWYKSILYHSITNKLNKNYWVMKQVKITDPGQQPTKLSQIRRTLNFTLSFFQSLCPKVKKILTNFTWSFLVNLTWKSNDRFKYLTGKKNTTKSSLIPNRSSQYFYGKNPKNSRQKK